MTTFRITYDDPPPQPTERITFEVDSAHNEANIVSPVRKQRRPKASIKRMKLGHGATSTFGASTESQNCPTTRSKDQKVKASSDINTHQDIGPLEMDTSPPPSSPDFPAHSTPGILSDEAVVEPQNMVQNSIGEASYDAFVDSVLSAESDFWQISRNLFIVNGWNKESNIGTNTFYHLQMVVIGLKRDCHCLCPDGREGDECFHIRFLADYDLPSENENKTVLFSRNVLQFEPSIYHNVFSVKGSGLFTSVKARAIVEHCGEDSGIGTWKCSRDPNQNNCCHISAARDSLQQHIQLDLSAKDVNGPQEFHLGKSTNVLDFTFFEADHPVLENFVRDAGSSTTAVSSKSIPPPRWARLSSDPVRPTIPPVHQAPDLIPLTPSSSCPCKHDGRVLYSAGSESRVESCEVYGLTRMWRSKIELQNCTVCKRRFIGPDGQELGLFNWNNRVLVSHDLLDDYTCSYTTSETPFAAWVSVMQRRYQTHGSPQPFLSERRFRVIWFAYARLLELDNDMCCRKCGPTPNATIWDGVTLAFSRKHLKPSLCPPTTIHPTSKVRRKARHPRKPQCFEDPYLRKLLRHTLTGPELRWINDGEVPADLVGVDEDFSDDESEEISQLKAEHRAALARYKAAVDMRSRLECIEEVGSRLGQIDASLASLFDQCYGLQKLIHGHKAPSAYTTLFLHMASEDSVLQLITLSDMEYLDRFIKDPTFQNASHLNMFPALYTVIMLELSKDTQLKITDDLLGLCHWILLRGMTVLVASITERGGEKDAVRSSPDDDWQKTGCLYSMPQIRNRPQYPSIPRDGLSDIGGQAKRGSGCGKYFSEYGQKRLTGGIMVVWCTHTVCYGFHCIPAAEGRNEVFSAIYTHWEKAPEIIIYDYACNLAPYLMAREPVFFAKTRCLIDHFHSAGHSACGDPCKLKTYVSANASLDRINSSAAECGNSGILRIRKSVSYMTQDHAIIYTKVFLSIRNRLILQKQEQRGNA
ncbi:hypothetical protein CVT26_002453 [Gymnopilus dilepis]|uniref:HMG domain-containing protein n=1 Tax=Gymnopilus dilepis TaxID=231916 RepID=A0A409VT06_9AGAR|nr:hypothetical protein CVT26_002453 [Gymnopilus dilepis]